MVVRIGLYWIDETWPGKLALASRPRGGEWLRGDISDWKQTGIGSILSLLTPDEEEELGLLEEAQEAKAQGLEFISFPIPDLEVPKSKAKLAAVLDRVNSALSSGTNVLVHCRQGIGRSGLVAACLLVARGMSPGAAAAKLSAARGVPVPETPEQRDWIDRYAAGFAK